MALKEILRGWLALEPKGEELPLDDPQTTLRHGRIIREKPFLRRIYLEHYAFLRNEARAAADGPWLELGSGGGFLKEVIPNVITSDVMDLPGVDRVFSALAMPYPDCTLGAILALNVLHHLPDIGRFFEEAERCLKPGGRVAMVEPANTAWARYVYRHFHHEPFCPESREWRLDGAGPLSCANGALPWIVFCRDRERFDARFPGLQVLRVECCQPFRYLLSGGVSMRSLVPAWSYGCVAGAETLLKPLNRYLGMFMRIVVVKRGTAAA